MALALRNIWFLNLYQSRSPALFRLTGGGVFTGIRQCWGHAAKPCLKGLGIQHARESYSAPPFVCRFLSGGQFLLNLTVLMTTADIYIIWNRRYRYADESNS